MSETVKFYTTKQVRVCDLPKLYRAISNEWLVIRIDGKWREVLDVWEDPEDAEHYPADQLRLAEQYLDTVTHLHIGVRYLVEEKSTGSDLEDALAFLRWRDLIEVQAPEDGFEWRTD